MPHRRHNGKLNWIVVSLFVASWLIVLGFAAFYASSASSQRTAICEATNENRDLLRAILMDSRAVVQLKVPGVERKAWLLLIDRELARVPSTVRCR